MESPAGAHGDPLVARGIPRREHAESGASNRWLKLVALATAALSVVFFSKGWLVAGAVNGLAVVSVELISQIRVTVNGRFVAIRYGQLAWLRQRVHMDRIVRASSYELVPMAQGGWGYRGSLGLMRRAAVVVRGGVALRLELEGNLRPSKTPAGAPHAVLGRSPPTASG